MQIHSEEMWLYPYFLNAYYIAGLILAPIPVKSFLRNKTPFPTVGRDREGNMSTADVQAKLQMSFH